MRSTSEQLPAAKSSEAKILCEITSMGAKRFEKFCSVILQELANKTNVQHRIKETRYVKDGGFDFQSDEILRVRGKWLNTCILITPGYSTCAV